MSSLEQQASEVGADLALALIKKVRETIDGFPASTVEQRVAITRLVALGLDEHANALEQS